MDSQAHVTHVASFFVRQYYTTLHDKPSELWRFYQEDSEFAINDEHEHGLETIKSRIARLDYKDCKVNVTSVDAQQSLGESVLVTVVGLISNKSTPFRDFLQTFVLAPQQPKGYYVRNDVFRHLGGKKTEVESEVHVAGPAAIPQPAAHAAPAKPAAKEHHAPVAAAKDHHAPKEQSAAPAQQATAPATAAVTSHAPAAAATSTTAPATSATKKEKAKTWAALVSSNATAPTVTAPAPQSRKPAAKQPTAAADSVSPVPADDDLAGVEGGHWVFVNKVAADVTGEQLRAALGVFGEITAVDIKKRTFQFVQFASADAAAAACNAGTVQIGNDRVVVEKRQQAKPRGTRGPRTDRKPRKDETSSADAAAPAATSDAEGEFRPQRKPRPQRQPDGEKRDSRPRDGAQQRDGPRPPRRQRQTQA